MTNTAAFLQLVLGLALLIYGAYKVDQIDAANGIRPGGYGSNISFVWPYSFCCHIGFVIALVAPLTLLAGTL